MLKSRDLATVGLLMMGSECGCLGQLEGLKIGIFKQKEQFDPTFEVAW